LEKLKIAVYSGDIPSTTFIENLIEGLADFGFEIYLFGKLKKKVNYKNNVKVFPTPLSGIKLLFFIIKESLLLSLKNPKLFYRTVKKIRDREKNLKMFLKNLGVLLPILNNKPDVFHIQWAKVVEMYPELFDLLECKFALSLRGAHINYSPLTDEKLAAAYRRLFPRIDGFHAVSEAIGTEALKYGADKSKIKVIHSSIKNELLGKNSGLYNGKQILEMISIGRFHWKKGYHYALDAVRILKDKGIEINYTIVAQGDIPEEILFMIDEYKIKDNIKIIQGLPHKELVEKLMNSHLLLLPSVEEGIANVVLEAMAVGIPVLTTDCGGMNEVIKDKFNGYIIPVRSPECISGKVSGFVNSDSEFKINITAKAKEVIRKEFSREKQVREFSEFYSSL
jgi:colanic acid/amylovoran biosynthesis glycosyltransferase